MAMLRWSVNITTLFLGKLDSTVSQYFVHILSLVTIIQGKARMAIMINLHEGIGLDPCIPFLSIHTDLTMFLKYPF